MSVVGERGQLVLFEHILKWNCVVMASVGFNFCSRAELGWMNNTKFSSPFNNFSHIKPTEQ